MKTEREGKERRQRGRVGRRGERKEGEREHEERLRKEEEERGGPGSQAPPTHKHLPLHNHTSLADGSPSPPSSLPFRPVPCSCYFKALLALRTLVLLSGPLQVHTGSLPLPSVTPRPITGSPIACRALETERSPALSL